MMNIKTIASFVIFSGKVYSYSGTNAIDASVLFLVYYTVKYVWNVSHCSTIGMPQAIVCAKQLKRKVSR